MMGDEIHDTWDCEIHRAGIQAMRQRAAELRAELCASRGLTPSQACSVGCSTCGVIDASPPAAARVPLTCHVGDTRFEGWLSCHEPDRRDTRVPRYSKQDMRDAYLAGHSEASTTPPAAARVPDDYGATDFGFTFDGLPLTDGDKRLAALLTNALGNDHPAFDDFVALLFAARSKPAAARVPLPMARSLTDELMDCVDRLGSEFDAVDPRVWDHLRVYMPTAARVSLTNDQMIDAIAPLCASRDIAALLVQNSLDEYQAIERAHGITGGAA